MTILNFVLDLIDSLSLLSSLNPCALYPGESLYWRLGGIILLAFVPGMWLFSGMPGDTVCVAASIVSGLWLIVHLVIRSSFASNYAGGQSNKNY
ncbi:MAG: hypothetical protein LUE13_09015 [Akkermansiaceae bacterium]|nr:hypothetical protein [Akkermansiaceae bacterium]